MSRRCGAAAHLGPAVSALLDGELDHLRRERVLAHLAHCLPCRSEVEAQRRFKASLRDLPPPPVPAELADRLRALGSDVAPAPLPSYRPTGVSPPRPATARRPRAATGPGRVSRRRRRAVSGALLAFGLGGALALGGPPASAPVARVDPASATFVTRYVATLPEVPFTEPDVVSASLLQR